MNAEGIGGVRRLRGRRGSGRGGGALRALRRCRRLCRSGSLRPAVSLNFIDQAINFIHDTVDRIREGFSVFYLLNLPTEKVHRLEDHVEQLRPELLRHHVDGFFPDDEEQVLDPVGHRHDVVELHHGRRTLYRMHDAEDLVDAVL